MTNLTEQEIQDAKTNLKTLHEVLKSNYGSVGAGKPILEAINKGIQALDIAEKQVWLPISEAEDGFDGLIAFKDGRVERGRMSKPSHIFCGVYIYDIDEAAHYMPLPTPRV